MAESSRSTDKYRLLYIPKTLSELWDLMASMLGGAPTYRDKTGYFRDQDIDTEFYRLVEGFGVVRKKLGEERYARSIELAARAKALFVADPEDKTGETSAGLDLLNEIEEIIHEVRSRRAKAKLKDDEGEVTGD